ncbi:unnamed protein product [Schistosoma margrebowiei]|uniref:Uncharacterized protein n=1 Tax=Schistosoma margrebowiei TaxID=48269 RepID=A0A183LQA2_9TREM|nr:unnamed protein product [Schistosoma margrebowiei]
MVVGGSQQETLDPGFVLLGTRHQGVPVILRELELPRGFDPVSPSFTVKDAAPYFLPTISNTTPPGVPSGATAGPTPDKGGGLGMRLAFSSRRKLTR